MPFAHFTTSTAVQHLSLSLSLNVPSLADKFAAMFYSHEILCFGSGSLALLWLAAAKKPPHTKRFTSANLCHCLEAFSTALPTLALRLQSALLLGAIRIFALQISSLFASAVELRSVVDTNGMHNASSLKVKERQRVDNAHDALYGELPAIESFSLNSLLNVSESCSSAAGAVEATRVRRASLSSSVDARLSSSSIHGAFGFDWSADAIGGELAPFESPNTSAFSSPSKRARVHLDSITEISNYTARTNAFAAFIKQRWEAWQKAQTLHLLQSEFQFQQLHQPKSPEIAREAFGAGAEWPSPPTRTVSSSSRISLSPAPRRPSISSSTCFTPENATEQWDEYPLEGIASVREAVDVFFRLLVLLSSNVVRVEQRIAYGVIRVVKHQRECRQ